jgi:Tol biopolymer transport system component
MCLQVRKTIHKIFLFSFIILIALSLSCHKDNPIDGGKPPCGGIDPGIVPNPPYNSPIWHPSGQFIGFNHTPLRNIVYPNPCYPEQVFAGDSTGFWLINSDGTNKRRIFPYTLQTPAWSPDGKWIAFVSGAQILKMRFTGTIFDTTTLTQLTSAGGNFFPTWSPDGQWIAYDRSITDGSGPAGVWIMRIDGTERKAVFGGAFPAWHPSGNILIGVVGTSFTSVWTRFVQYDLLQLKAIDTLSAVVGNDNRQPHYSPDGTKIAFWSSGNLWLMDTTGNNQHQLTTRGADVEFNWSPSGNRIVYARYQSTDWTMNNGVLWMIDVYSKTETQFTFNP